jgi:hypothetical protein
LLENSKGEIKMKKKLNLINFTEINDEWFNVLKGMEIIPDKSTDSKIMIRNNKKEHYIELYIISDSDEYTQAFGDIQYGSTGNYIIDKIIDCDDNNDYDDYDDNDDYDDDDDDSIDKGQIKFLNSDNEIIATLSFAIWQQEYEMLNFSGIYLISDIHNYPYHLKYNSRCANEHFNHVDLTNFLCEWISYKTHEVTRKIKQYSFSCCDRLQTVEVPNNLNIICEGAFYGCKNLTDVYYHGTKEQREKLVIEDDNNALLNATWHYIEN